MIHVIHHNDADGRLSAYLVGKGKKDVRYEEADYREPPDFYEVMPNDEVWIVDYSLKDWSTLQAIGCKVVWIDHHKTAKGPDFPGIRRTGTAACLLTCEYLGITPRLVAKLVGDYDVWAYAFKETTLFFHAGIELYDQDPALEFWKLCWEDIDFMQRIIDKGRTIVEYQDQFYKSLRESIGFETTFDGHKTHALNIAHTGSRGLGFGGWAMPDDVIYCVFYWDGAKWTISLYSANIDVGAIALKRGGGGHTGAAGFTVDVIPKELMR